MPRPDKRMGKAQASDASTDPRLFVRALSVRIISSLSEPGVASGPLIAKLSRRSGDRSEAKVRLNNSEYPLFSPQ